MLHRKTPISHFPTQCAGNTSIASLPPLPVGRLGAVRPQVHPDFDVLPPIARRAAQALCQKLDNAPPLMVRTHLLSVLSSAVAPLYRVVPPDWNPMPISVNTLCVSDVGGAKSPIHDNLIKSLKDHDQQVEQEFPGKLAEAQCKEEQRKLNERVLTKEIMRTRGDRDLAKALHEELNLVRMAKEAMPKPHLRMVDDLDKESLVHLLEGKYEAADFITDEGGKLLRSSLMRNHHTDLVKLIDGACITHGREKKRRMSAWDPTCTFGLMTQAHFLEPFRPFYKNNKYVSSPAVEQGFWARFLVYINSGIASYTASAHGSYDQTALDCLHDFLAMNYREHRTRQENGQAPLLLTFDERATSLWKQLCEGIEQAMANRPHLKGHIAKWMNLTARVASLFHVCESTSLAISADCLYRAWDVVMFHADHYERLFTATKPPTLIEEDVAAICNLISTLSPFVRDKVCTETIRIRLSITKRRLLDALFVIREQGFIEITDSKTAYINCTRFPVPYPPLLTAAPGRW